MGLLDDWMDLKWRYKAFMPLIAALPLIYLTLENPLTRTSIVLPLIGTIDFGAAYYFVIIPLIIMVVTNTVNQLGGLNGLETVCPAIILIGLMVLSPSNSILMLGPLLFWLILTRQDFRWQLGFVRYRHEHSLIRSNHRPEIAPANFNSTLRF